LFTFRPVVRPDLVARVYIRQFRPDDAAALIEIFRSAVRTVARRDYTQAQVIAWAPEVIDTAAWEARCAIRHTFVADIDGIPAGFTELESNGHLDMMYVDARYQGRGIASALLTHAESAAREWGVVQFFTEASITARTFFERRGFELIAPQVVSRRGQEFINYRMVKSL
jgi:putative acetyltransferase